MQTIFCKLLTCKFNETQGFSNSATAVHKIVANSQIATMKNSNSCMGWDKVIFCLSTFLEYFVFLPSKCDLP